MRNHFYNNSSHSVGKKEMNLSSLIPISLEPLCFVYYQDREVMDWNQLPYFWNSFSTFSSILNITGLSFGSLLLQIVGSWIMM